MFRIKIRYTNFHFIISDSLLDILDLIFYFKTKKDIDKIITIPKKVDFQIILLNESNQS
jgi:hypothetical protein